MQDPEILHLKDFFNKISFKLRDPFLQRRARTESHKQDIFQELRDAVEQIIDKQKELNELVSISSSLLQKNSALFEQNRNFMTSKLENDNKIRQLNQEVKTLKESLWAYQAREHKKQEELARFEQENIELIQMKAKLELEIAELVELPQQQAGTLEKYQDQIEELNNGMSEKALEYQLSVQKLKKQLQEQKSLRMKMIEEYEILAQEKQSLNKEKEIFSKQLSFKDNKIQDCEAFIVLLEEKTDDLTQKNQDLKNKVQKLNTQLQTSQIMRRKLQNLGSFVQSGDQLQITYQSSYSLGLELQDLDNSLNEEKVLFRNGSSLVTNLAVQAQKGVKVLGLNLRKPAPEQFFHLTAQCVKINSPYMDKICTVSTSMLYKKALKEGILIHNWRQWVEKELNSEYIRMLYDQK